jgi:hypothetical protein
MKKDPKDGEPSVPYQEDRFSRGFDWHKRAGPVFKHGLITGFALIMLGGAALSLALMNVHLATLVVCAGLSIILGAFGSTATVTLRGQSTTLVGVAGIAITLLTVVLGEMDDRYVRVKIGGDIEGAQVELVGDRSYLGAFQQSERSFDFIIFGKEIKRPVLSLYITLRDQIERHFACISKDVVGPFLASGRTIEWVFDNKNGVLLNIETRRPIADMGPCSQSGTTKDHTEKSLESTLDLSIISTAFAEEFLDPDPNGTQQLMQKLESSADYERRIAQNAIGQQGNRGGCAVT